MKMNKVYKVIRQDIIKHLKFSGIRDVSLDDYVGIAVWIFSLVKARVGSFEDLPEDLVEIVMNQKFALSHQKEQANYIANLLLNIKNNVKSKPCEGLTVKCDVCNAFSLLTKSHTSGHHNSYIYYCENCDATVKAHNGDKWPVGTLTQSHVHKLRTELNRKVENLSSPSVSKRALLIRVAKRIRVCGSYIANIQTVSNEVDYQRFNKALDSIKRDLVSAKEDAA